jgi:hypothetical protein
MQKDPWLENWEARRKERESADRSFEVLGETLVAKASVAPEIGLRLAEFQSRIAVYVPLAQEAQEKGKPLPDLGVSDEELLALSEATIRACLEPASHEAWARLRDPERADPMSLMDIYGFATYVLSKATALPTGAPAGSSSGQASNGRSSTAASPYKAQARKR